MEVQIQSASSHNTPLNFLLHIAKVTYTYKKTWKLKLQI